MAKRSYTDEDRERARVAWETTGHNVNATARETGIPLATIHGWAVAWRMPPPEVAPVVIQAAFETIRMDKKTEIINAAWDLARAAFTQAQAKLVDANARDAATVAAIAIDKAQLLSGGATERHDIRAIINSLPEPARQAVVSLLAESDDAG